MSLLQRLCLRVRERDRCFCWVLCSNKLNDGVVDLTFSKVTFLWIFFQMIMHLTHACIINENRQWDEEKINHFFPIEVARDILNIYQYPH